MGFMFILSNALQKVKRVGMMKRKRKKKRRNLKTRKRRRKRKPKKMLLKRSKAAKNVSWVCALGRYSPVSMNVILPFIK